MPRSILDFPDELLDLCLASLAPRDGLNLAHTCRTFRGLLSRRLQQQFLFNLNLSLDSCGLEKLVEQSYDPEIAPHVERVTIKFGDEYFDSGKTEMQIRSGFITSCLSQALGRFLNLKEITISLRRCDGVMVFKWLSMLQAFRPNRLLRHTAETVVGFHFQTVCTAFASSCHTELRRLTIKSNDSAAPLPFYTVEEYARNPIATFTEFKVNALSLAINADLHDWYGYVSQYPVMRSFLAMFCYPSVVSLDFFRTDSHRAIQGILRPAINLMANVRSMKAISLSAVPAGMSVQTVCRALRNNFGTLEIFHIKTLSIHASQLRRYIALLRAVNTAPLPLRDVRIRYVLLGNQDDFVENIDHRLSLNASRPAKAAGPSKPCTKPSVVRQTIQYAELVAKSLRV